MSKVTIEISPAQITEAAESLPEREKLRLLERLERATIKARWRQIFRDIDSRLKRFPISKQEALKEIQAYRKEKSKHAQGRH